MVSALEYEMAIGLVGLVVALVFLYLLDLTRDWEERKRAYKFTAALTLFSVSIMTQVVEETWTVIEIAGVTFPPLNVIFEALVAGFLISGLIDYLDI